jgi:hypothetical protein
MPYLSSANILKYVILAELICASILLSATHAWAIPEIDIDSARPKAGSIIKEKLYGQANPIIKPGLTVNLGGQAPTPTNGQWPTVSGKTVADLYAKVPGADPYFDKKNNILKSAVKIPDGLFTVSEWNIIQGMTTNDTPYIVTGPNYGFTQMKAALMENALDHDPQRTMHEAEVQTQAKATQTGDAAADTARGQAASAIGFCSSYIENFTTQPQWNLVRDQIFVPMAILLLLPGAVLAQVRAIIAAGSPVLGEVNPFEGILRSIVAIFLIPATALVVNYGIDLNNSIAFTINSEYLRIFGSDMYRDALCAEMRATPVRQTQSNRNALDGKTYNGQPLVNKTATNFGLFEASMVENSIQDPCSGINLAPAAAANENMSSGMVATRLMMNGSNASLTTAWNVLCAFQLAYLYYLWCVGPIMAALWVYPLRSLRNALPSWVEGVVTLCFWSLFWNTVILLMACFKGVDETGTMIMTALNFLATASVKYAFDFAGLVKAAGQEAAGMAAGAAKKAAQNAGGHTGKTGGGASSNGGAPLPKPAATGYHAAGRFAEDHGTPEKNSLSTGALLAYAGNDASGGVGVNDNGGGKANDAGFNVVPDAGLGQLISKPLELDKSLNLAEVTTAPPADSCKLVGGFDPSMMLLAYAANEPGAGPTIAEVSDPEPAASSIDATLPDATGALVYDPVDAGANSVSYDIGVDQSVNYDDATTFAYDTGVDQSVNYDDATTVAYDTGGDPSVDYGAANTVAYDTGGDLSVDDGDSNTVAYSGNGNDFAYGQTADGDTLASNTHDAAVFQIDYDTFNGDTRATSFATSATSVNLPDPSSGGNVAQGLGSTLFAASLKKDLSDLMGTDASHSNSAIQHPHLLASGSWLELDGKNVDPSSILPPPLNNPINANPDTGTIQPASSGATQYFYDVTGSASGMSLLSSLATQDNNTSAFNPALTTPLNTSDTTYATALASSSLAGGQNFTSVLDNNTTGSGYALPGSGTDPVTGLNPSTPLPVTATDSNFMFSRDLTGPMGQPIDIGLASNPGFTSDGGTAFGIANSPANPNTISDPTLAATNSGGGVNPVDSYSAVDQNRPGPATSDAFYAISSGTIGPVPDAAIVMQNGGSPPTIDYPAGGQTNFSPMPMDAPISLGGSNSFVQVDQSAPAGFSPTQTVATSSEGGTLVPGNSASFEASNSGYQDNSQLTYSAPVAGEAYTAYNPTSTSSPPDYATGEGSNIQSANYANVSFVQENGVLPPTVGGSASMPVDGSSNTSIDNSGTYSYQVSNQPVSLDGAFFAPGSTTAIAGTAYTAINNDNNSCSTSTNQSSQPYAVDSSGQIQSSYSSQPSTVQGDSQGNILSQVASAGQATYATYGTAASADWMTSYSVQSTVDHNQTDQSHWTQNNTYNNGSVSQENVPTSAQQVSDNSSGNSHVQDCGPEVAVPPYTGYSWFASGQINPRPSQQNAGSVGFESPKPLSMLGEAASRATGHKLPAANRPGAVPETRFAANTGNNGPRPMQTTSKQPAVAASYQPPALNGDQPPPLERMTDSLQTAVILGNQRGGRIQKPDNEADAAKAILDRITGISSHSVV